MTSAADRPLRLTTALLAGGLLLVASAAFAGNPQREGDSKITRNAAGATPRSEGGSSTRNSPPPSSPPPRAAPSPPPSHGSGGSVRGRNEGKIPSRDEAIRDRDSGHSRYRYRYPGHHYPYRYRHYGYYDPFYYPYYPSWLYWGWGPSFYGWYGGYGPRVGVRVGGGYGGGGVGALDLDVVPESAEVWVDGERVGTADDFDGFPSYLWLEEGTYDVALYAPGYETLARQYSVQPGSLIPVEDRLARGESVRPEDLPSQSTVNRDERLRRDEERREDAERWREAERWRDEDDEDDEDDQEPTRRDEAPGDDVARLHLRVFPGDAAVYLDGHFIGTGDELGRLSAGLIVEPGEHLVEAVRPGYQSRNREIEVEEGGQLEVDIDLTRP